MDKLISQQAAIDTLRKMQTYKLFAGDDMLLIDQAEAQTELMMLPSAQPELKELSEWKADFKGYINDLNMPKDDYDGIMEYIDEVPSAQPEQRWVPVSERLPEIDKEVLVTDGELCWVCSLFESQDIEDGLYQWEDNYGHWHDFETWVAWMPLPEPWKGEEDETD